jgi:hypothetical protein
VMLEPEEGAAVSDEWEAFRNDEGEPIRAEELRHLNLKDMPEDIHISIMDHYFPDTRICSRAVGCDQRPLSCPATVKVLWGTISDRRSSELRCGCKTFLAVGKDVITSKVVGRAGSDRPLLPQSGRYVVIRSVKDGITEKGPFPDSVRPCDCRGADLSCTRSSRCLPNDSTVFAYPRASWSSTATRR